MSGDITDPKKLITDEGLLRDLRSAVQEGVDEVYRLYFRSAFTIDPATEKVARHGAVIKQHRALKLLEHPHALKLALLLEEHPTMRAFITPLVPHIKEALEGGIPADELGNTLTKLYDDVRKRPKEHEGAYSAEALEAMDAEFNAEFNAMFGGESVEGEEVAEKTVLEIRTIIRTIEKEVTKDAESIMEVLKGSQGKKLAFAGAALVAVGAVLHKMLGKDKAPDFQSDQGRF